MSDKWYALTQEDDEEAKRRLNSNMMADLRRRRYVKHLEASLPDDLKSAITGSSGTSGLMMLLYAATTGDRPQWAREAFDAAMERAEK